MLYFTTPSITFSRMSTRISPAALGIPKKFRVRAYIISIVLNGLVIHTAYASTPNKPTKPANSPFSTPNEKCIIPASNYHQINPIILRSILRIESGLRPNTIAKNTNGSIDVGIGGYNSINFKELAKFGVTPEHLMDACIGTYVSAWHLSKIIARHGNTWQGIARYNSGTPYFNYRYQTLLFNEMVKSGLIEGELLRVPPRIRLQPSTQSTYPIQAVSSNQQKPKVSP